MHIKYLILFSMLIGCGENTLRGANPVTCKKLGEPGPYAKALDTTPCCNWLEHTSVQFEKKTAQDGPYCSELPGVGHSYCLECGDGVCDPEYEDECFCPEDCGEIPRDRYIRGDGKTVDGQDPNFTP